MKKYLSILTTCVLFVCACAQTGINKSSFVKEGKIFVTWGWNRAMYSNSDIHFQGPDYNFSLHSVIAKDRPSPLTYHNYLQWDRITIPQTNLRIGYFMKDNLAFVFSIDHMKYVMEQKQNAKFSGYISDPTYSGMIKDGRINLENEDFLTFEHTDGLNYVNLGIEGYKILLNNGKNFDLSWGYGVGAGILYPKSNVKLFMNPRSDWFHLAGFGTDIRTNLNLLLWKGFLVRAEAKYGYINMPDIKTTLDRPDNFASQDFAYLQANIGLGFVFGTKKSN